MPTLDVQEPASIDELREVVRRAIAEGLAVYPGGTGAGRSPRPSDAPPGIAISTRRLDRVVDHPAADMTITVEAGITLGRLRATLAEHGQVIRLESPNPDAASIGGLLATATTGPRRFGWGRPRDQIIGVGFVDAAGRLIRGGGRVVKNVAGYDLPKLLTGSRGTLGIIVEATLKVAPRPESSAAICARLSSLAEAETILANLNASSTRPIALELIGPGPDEGEWKLIAGFEGNRPAVDWQATRWAEEVGPDLVESMIRDELAEASWLDLVEPASDGAGEVGFSVSLRPSRGLAWLATVDVDRWALRADAGNGLIVGASRAGSFSSADEAAGEVAAIRRRAEELGGSLIVGRWPDDWGRIIDVTGDRRPDWELARRIKQALDPDRRMNPTSFLV